MSQQEQDSADPEIQRIFLNSTEETVEENTAAENRPSAPVHVENVCSLSSSESEEIDSPLNAIYWPIPANLTQSETGLNLAQSIPTGSGTVPLTRSSPVQNDEEIVSAVATTSPIQHLLVRDGSGPSPSQVQRHMRTQEEVTGTPAAGRHHEISRIIDRQCLCKSCIGVLLHSGNPKSYYTKKFSEHCTLCEYKTLMTDYQKICKECSRRKNLCVKCVSCAVITEEEFIFDFDKLLEGEEGQIFSRLAEMIQHRIIFKVYGAFDIGSSKFNSEKNAETCFRYMIQKYK